MKRSIAVLLTAALLLSLLTVPAMGAEDLGGKTVILYTGNLRGDVDVYPQIKAAKDAYEAAGADVLLVDAGNFLQGSAAANTSRGAVIYDLMDAVGYDAAAMGLGEFSYADATTGYLYHGNYTRYYTQRMLQEGTEAVEYAKNRDGSVTASLAAREPAGFQTLAYNLLGGTDVYAYGGIGETETAGGLKVFFIGFTDPDVTELVPDGLLEIDDTLRMVALEGYDLVVSLSNGAQGEASAQVLADYNQGVPGVSVSIPTGGAPIIGAFIVDNETLEITRADVDRSGSDPAVAAMAAQAKADAAPVVGTSEVVLNGADSANWTRETNLGDLTADALLWYGQNYIDGVDPDVPMVALQNGGNLDNFLYTGDVTEVDLLRALPFSPMGVGVLYVTGRELLETLEAGTCPSERYGDLCPGFVHVAGMSYTLDRTQAYDAGAAFGNYYVADSVNRVSIREVGCNAFDPEATYAVVADNYILNGNDTFYTLKASKEAQDARYINNGGGVKTRDIVALYIQRELGGVIGEDYAAPQGRIRLLDSAFTDVKTSDWFLDPVNWAVSQGVTKGVSETEFAPLLPCDRGQFVTLLWRAADQPAPASTENPFSDVDEDSPYYTAILWAAENHIANGLGDGTFQPGGQVKRQDVVTFLWRFAESPAAEPGGFQDVAPEDYFYDAVSWAVARGVTTGLSPERFDPAGICNRAQVVTFLYRYFHG